MGEETYEFAYEFGLQGTVGIAAIADDSVDEPVYDCGLQGRLVVVRLVTFRVVGSGSALEQQLMSPNGANICPILSSFETGRLCLQEKE